MSTYIKLILFQRGNRKYKLDRNKLMFSCTELQIMISSKDFLLHLSAVYSTIYMQCVKSFNWFQDYPTLLPGAVKFADCTSAER